MALLAAAERWLIPTCCSRTLLQRTRPLTRQAAASDDGLCLVFDSAAFSGSGAKNVQVAHVASGRLGDGSAAPAAAAPSGAPAAESAGAGSGGGEGGEPEAKAEADGELAEAAAPAAPAPPAADGAGAADTGAIQSLAWHSSGSLVLGTSTGECRSAGGRGGCVKGRALQLLHAVSHTPVASPVRLLLAPRLWMAPHADPSARFARRPHAGVVGALQPVRAAGEEPAADLQVDASALRRPDSAVSP